jgi:hypothetical protein
MSTNYTSQLSRASEFVAKMAGTSDFGETTIMIKAPAIGPAIVH